MDFRSLAPIQHLVKTAITGPSGTPNWSVILQILSEIESSPQLIPDFITVIKSYLSNGKQVMNSLILIDALFKNSKRQQLIYLQSPRLFKELNRYQISENPRYHNFIFKSSPAWIAQCSQHECLDTDFKNWQQNFCSSRYVPKMSLKLREKFFSELDSSLEISGMFAQTLVVTSSNGGDANNQLLLEILPNVREILRRIGELEPLVVDVPLLHGICTVRDFSDLSLKCYRLFAQKKEFDQVNLLEKLSQAKIFMQKLISKASQEKSIKEKSNFQLDNEIPDDEFWNELNKIKKEEQPPPLVSLDLLQSPKVEDSLIDF